MEKDKNVQFLCQDCENYNRCEYYYNRKEFSYICKYFHLPAITPQQRTGRWIDDDFGSKCSCCGIYTHLDKFDRPMKFKCCSMCGAKMEVLDAN